MLKWVVTFFEKALQHESEVAMVSAIGVVYKW